MSITTTEYCRHKSHFVPKGSVQMRKTGNGLHKRMCEDCWVKESEKQDNKQRLEKKSHGI